MKLLRRQNHSVGGAVSIVCPRMQGVPSRIVDMRQQLNITEITIWAPYLCFKGQMLIDFRAGRPGTEAVGFGAKLISRAKFWKCRAIFSIIKAFSGMEGSAPEKQICRTPVQIPLTCPVSFLIKPPHFDRPRSCTYMGMHLPSGRRSLNWKLFVPDWHTSKTKIFPKNKEAGPWIRLFCSEYGRLLRAGQTSLTPPPVGSYGYAKGHHLVHKCNLLRTTAYLIFMNSPMQISEKFFSIILLSSACTYLCFNPSNFHAVFSIIVYHPVEVNVIISSFFLES